MADLDEMGIPLNLPDRGEMLSAVVVENIAIRYHANPLEVPEWDASILRHLGYVNAYRSLGATVVAPGDDGMHDGGVW